MTHNFSLKMMTRASLFAALTAVGAYIAIPFPLSPAPVSLQTLFVLLAGLVLGKKWGAASMAVYLLAGAAGLPVFAGGAGGIGYFAGPTGGYLAGFVPAAFVIGAISEKRAGIVFDAAALALGSLIIYALGVSWLTFHTGFSFSKTLMIGMVPFLPGDALKIAAAVWIAGRIRPGTRPELIQPDLDRPKPPTPAPPSD
ncbi:Biotin transporter BioY [Candidatus Desulfarcum epimagneticum]|uniref:Biotin transporter n=1 Tax=uncultured Desulfobacteraceae bacterium TaxID=218296 RepID=A0A484HM19_9BACT|nr:Biotin transporter BioY [uncultured Desulfobacteraceae bacterium]